jgi:hypothetical protein
LVLIAVATFDSTIMVNGIDVCAREKRPTSWVSAGLAKCIVIPLSAPMKNFGVLQLRRQSHGCLLL